MNKPVQEELAAKDPSTLSQEELEAIELTERPNWVDGPPHAIFKELRGRCPVHRTEVISEYPDEDGFWSLSKADLIRQVSLDHQTYSSERGGVTGLTHAVPLELQQAMFIGMDPPKHDRLKMLFQKGFTPKRIAEHADEIRAIGKEGGDSRVWAGIHYPIDLDSGNQLGKAVAQKFVAWANADGSQ